MHHVTFIKLSPQTSLNPESQHRDSSLSSSRHGSITDQSARLHRDVASSHNSKMRTSKVNLTSPARTIDALLKARQRQQKLHKGEEGDFR